MNGDNITVLDAQVVTDHTVHSCTSIIKVIICQHDENSIFSLLSFYEDCVATEEL